MADVDLDELEQVLSGYNGTEALVQKRALAALIIELRERRAAEATRLYPDTLPTGERVMRPTASVVCVVSPSGFAERIRDHRPIGEYERLVTYVLARPPEKSGT